jgi:hypothetical protein
LSLDFDNPRDYILDMETRIKYWVCPQNPSEHVWDWDDWRIEQNYWTGVAKCPRDARPLEQHEAKVSDGR